jgi:hypothetical protein
MTLNSIVRAAGIGMIVSGLALGYSYISHPNDMTPEVIASTNWIIIHTLFAVSLAVGLLATGALYAPTSLRAGTVGLIGYLMLFFGMLLIFGLDYFEILIAPYLAEHYPAVIRDHGAGDTMGPVAVAFPLAGSLTVIGYALLAWGWMKSQVLPTPVASTLIVTALAFGFGLSPAGGIGIAQITATAFGLSLLAVGIVAFRHPEKFKMTE